MRGVYSHFTLIKLDSLNYTAMPEHHFLIFFHVRMHYLNYMYA